MNEEKFKSFLSEYKGDIEMLYINDYWGTEINLEEGYNGETIKKLSYNYPKIKNKDCDLYKKWLSEVKTERGV